MGCISSQPTNATNEGQRSNHAALKKKSVDYTVEMVLLGQGESGKSTIFKQMKIIQAQEEGLSQAFSESDYINAKALIYDGIVGQMKVLLKVAFEEEMDFTNEDNKRLAHHILETPIDGLKSDSAEVGAMIKQLWMEEALKEIYGERDRLFNLNDSAGYFWDSIERIYAPNYIPTQADLLRVRVRTVGFEEATFTYKKTGFHVVDLGGQRSERRDWQDALNVASTILFVSSLCEWDQKLREDFSQCRFHETLHIFQSLVEDPATSKKGIIIFLNKRDLFQSKMEDPERRTNFTRFFPEYKGVIAVEPCLNFLKEKFTNIAHRFNRRNLTIHTIVAIETDNIQVAWRDIRNQTIADVVQAVM